MIVSISIIQAAMLDEMDEVFGVSALVPAAPPPPQYTYSQDSLRGLRVAHRIDEVTRVHSQLARCWTS